MIELNSVDFLVTEIFVNWLVLDAFDHVIKLRQMAYMVGNEPKMY